MEITPQTRIGDLLDAHPGLEDTLVAAAPAFAKLRNPVLRATVARFATLAHAAQVSGVPLPELMGILRGALGLDAEACPAAGGPVDVAEAWPDWVREDTAGLCLDATELLAQGEHPWAPIQAFLTTSAPGATVILVSDFVPAPLLDRAQARGWLAACARKGDRYGTALRRP
ncbi:DUF1858 domain-containing protein [Mesoterricola sediminis]|uniref:DUF1858 domain-containing protein n=1 Tax=Mesoterricola sediminis TaxID=2927980 RepID=A0AA48H059_9BACT|nr:DUF1858 domain-containing protein [Mesoterricola sediminis]BDU77580.1 hypothetical protein METESE_25380 [Mesoterricola sediminis]